MADRMSRRRPSGVLASFASVSLVGSAAVCVLPGEASARERWGSDDRPHNAAASHRRWRILADVDLMLGFGRSLVASQTQPSGTVAAPQTIVDERDVFVESWILSAGVGFAHGVDLRLRVPLTYMSFRSDVYRLGAAALGDVGLDVRWSPENSRFSFALALTAPTAQGDPPTPPRFDQNSSNRYLAGRASQSVRGHEVDYLFAWKRFGVAPSVFAFVPLGPRTALVPYVRLEGRIQSSGGDGNSLETASVFGARVSHRLSGTAVAPESPGGTEVALRAFTAVPMSGVDDHRASVVVEPQLAASAGHFVALLGVLIPVVGPSTDPRFVGIHAILSARL